MKKLVMLAAAALLSSSLGCGDPAQNAPLVPDSVGKVCTVYLRRDAMGMGADLPAPPAASNLNGVDLSVTGELLETNASWLRIKTDARTYTIPCSVILMVERMGA